MTSPVIEATGLTKAYGRKTVVDGIALDVEEGEVIGLLGPNGAGKTTTILMLLGLTEPSAGTVRILGKDPLRQPLEVKREVGYLPDSVGFYDNLSGRENLRFTARLAGFSPEEADTHIDDALRRVRLFEVGNQRVGTYSHGMRQRLGLAELIMRECRVLILDEPTSGLDPQSTEDLLALIGTFAREGMTILISSHMLDVVQSICNRVALFNKGRIGFVGSVDALAERVTDGAFRVDVFAGGVDLAGAGKVDGVTGVAPVSEGHWQVSASRDVRSDLARWVVNEGGDLESLDIHHIGLGEAYNRFFKEFGNEA